MDWIEVNGAGLRYELTGSGQNSHKVGAIVLVHEMGASLESWDGVAPGLARARRVLRYDTRGAGQSEKLRGSADMGVMADDIAGLLDALGVAGPVAIAGGAVGAAISLSFALRHPARVNAIIAMAPAIGLTPERRAQVLERAQMIEQGGMRAAGPNALDASYAPAVRQDMRRYTAFRARWYANDPGSFAAINRMLAGIDLTPELKRITCPTLVLAGRHDHVRPPEVVEPVARAIPGAQYRVIETGHFMPAQTPELIERTIREFLDGLS